MRIFLRIAALFFKYWPRALVTYLCLIAGAGMALLIPSLTGRAIDTAVTSGEAGMLVLIALAIGGVGFLRSILSYGQSYLGEYLSEQVVFDLRSAFYNHLQKLSFAFHDRAQTGQLMSRATVDVEEVGAFVGFALLRGVYFLLLMVAITALLLILDWKLALLSLWIVPVISYRTIAINRRLRVLWAKVQQNIGILGTIIQENLSGIRVVRAFSREEHENRKFYRKAETIYRQEIEANNLLATNSPVMSFALLLAMAIILWYGGRQVISGALTQGELVQFLLYLVMLGLPVRMLGWLTILYSRAMASGKRIYEILDQVSPVCDLPGARELTSVEGRVVFENVSFGYDPQNPILKGISFEARPGRIVALVGASGSGKSTVVNLIPRFYDVTGGRIMLDGQDIRSIKLSSLRRNTGIVHQDTFLFSGTIRENISYGKPDASLEEVVRVAKLARLHDFIAGLPDGYNTLVGERGITLSGGQKQRLSIARSLLLDPRILIMDDSTASVDTETEYLIRQTLTEALAGRTVFVIAHRLRSVQMADLILVLQDGRIVERGTHRELLEKNGIYRQLYALQFQDQEEAALAPALTTAEMPPPSVSENGDGRKPAGEAGGAQPSDRLSLQASDDVEFGKPYDSRVVSRMVGYFKAHPVALTLTIAATLLFTFSSVLNPYLVGLAENNYISTGNAAGLNNIVLLFIGLAVLNLISYYTQIRAEAQLGQGVLLKLRSQLFSHLQRLPLRFFSHNEVGRIMSRVQNDIGELGDFLDSGAFWVIGEVATLIAIVFIMFGMDWRLALLSLSVIPLLLVFIVIWQKRARRSYIQARQTLSRVNSALEENISGVRVIQSLSREELNSRQFESVNRANFQSNVRAAKFSAIMMPGVELLVSAAVTLIILFGGMDVLNGTLLVGTLVAFVLYIQNFFDPIRMLTYEYGQLQRAMASGHRVFELMDVPPETPDERAGIRPGRLKGEIRFESVSFGYEPGQEVLHNIDLHIPAGSTAALVGPTGAGKSTIINLIARFYEVTGGRILVDEYDLHNIDAVAFRKQIGLVLQDPFLFSGTIRDNILYGNPEAAKEEIEAAARAVGAHDFILRLEKGYDTELQERGQNLSIGQRQLISFARALLADPVILLLDEATASIDSYSEHILQQGLKKLMQGRTTVVIAHRLSTIRDADMIVVLDNGRIAEQGKHAELLARGGLYARLYGMTNAPVIRSGTAT